MSIPSFVCYDIGMNEIETLTNKDGETIAQLTWMDSGFGSEWCRIDDGIITRHRDASVTVRCQSSDGGIRTYSMPDLTTAWYTLGLSAHRRNGIDGWMAMTLLPGTAGRD